MPRLDRGIQYSRDIEIHHDRRGVLDRPIKSGDDSGNVAIAYHKLVIAANAAKQSRRPSADTFLESSLRS
jgi:hypothetical protein